MVRYYLRTTPVYFGPSSSLATPEGWAELNAALDEEVMHAEWSSKIAPTGHYIAAIGYFVEKVL
jgi:hypothetical protein